MDSEFSYAYPAELGLRTARRYVLRHAGWGILIFSGIAIYAAVNLWLTDAHWVFGALLAAGIGYNWLWYNYYQAIAKVCAGRANKPVVVRLSDRTLTVQVPDWTVGLEWTVIKEMWRLPQALMLFTEDRSWYVLLPLDAMSAEQRAFVQAKVLENKAKVV
jgi:hypothetical protein